MILCVKFKSLKITPCVAVLNLKVSFHYSIIQVCSSQKAVVLRQRAWNIVHAIVDDCITTSVSLDMNDIIKDGMHRPVVYGIGTVQHLIIMWWIDTSALMWCVCYHSCEFAVWIECNAKKNRALDNTLYSEAHTACVYWTTPQPLWFLNHVKPYRSFSFLWIHHAALFKTLTGCFCPSSGVNVKTGHVFPASFTCRGPAEELRSARTFSGGQVHGWSCHAVFSELAAV